MKRVILRSCQSYFNPKGSVMSPPVKLPSKQALPDLDRPMQFPSELGNLHVCIYVCIYV